MNSALTAAAAFAEALAEVRASAEEFLAHARDVDEVYGVVRMAEGAVLAAFEGATPVPEIANEQLARRVIARLRRALTFRLAAEPVPPADALQLLAALERVRHRLEPTYASRFADSLSGRLGLELVVELAHDLRSPLTSILFLSEALLRERSGPVTPVQRHQLGLVYSAALGLSGVASDVLELVRSEDRLTDREVVPFSVRETVESVRDMALPMADSKRLELRVWMPPETRLRIGRPQAINRVLLNLVTNALKFTNEGTVDLAVRVPPDAGDMVEFSVKDTGRGIPPQVLATLFEPFRRRHAEGDYAFSGAGLGLTICRKLVEGMGSELKVETSDEAGTRFWFRVPLPVAEEQLL